MFSYLSLFHNSNRIHYEFEVLLHTPYLNLTLIIVMKNKIGDYPEIIFEGNLLFYVCCTYPTLIFLLVFLSFTKKASISPTIETTPIAIKEIFTP